MTFAPGGHGVRITKPLRPTQRGQETLANLPPARLKSDGLMKDRAAKAEKRAAYRLASFLRKRELVASQLADWTAGKPGRAKKKRKKRKAVRVERPANPPEMRASARIAYGRRESALHSLGFASYGEYLNSATWSRIRGFVLAGSRCYGCGAKADQVHHGDYSPETLRGDNMAALFAVCATCHGLAEFAPDGRKRSPVEATANLERRHKRAKKKARRKAWRRDRVAAMDRQWSEAVARD
jgi:hypothetical protein